LREYNAIQGRWWTPDPAGLAVVDPTSPQSWNRYGYVGGMPLNFTDPTGLLRNIPPGCYWSGLDQEVICPPILGGGGGSGSGPCLNTLAVNGGHGIIPALACDGDGDGAGDQAGGSPTNGKPPLRPDEVPPNPCQFAGSAMSPQQYAALGHAAMWNPLTAVQDLKGFSIGGPLDAQPQASGDYLQRAAYGNYVYGVWMRASGAPLWVALEGANEIAWYHSLSNPNQFPGRRMASFFWSLPQANVINITAGYNAQAAGDLCHP
jgi:hypothetical protein